ncbi:class I SAM-dependent methyltransferase [Actinomadura graeca]|uniref:Class I SAM-dependent methyltransferase n=1 Tax=Actinomadura graeca TaxID=2750812 RepID=A0ABX8QQX1_9ACTN|nr:class I SAM-dependent methyltransferase [Actinomadura graeca]QXJ20599.1 class I SAM-dependent methyltransferase [Actinomadura graeca]
MTGYAPSWLALREPADAGARAADLLDPLRAALPPGPLLLWDVGCGTGSLARWLAPRLPGPQHWILYDSDPALLAEATVAAPHETRQGKIADLGAADLAGASLVAASALLDILTLAELDGLAAAITGARVPALLTLSVVGRVRLTPSDPLDAEIGAAFNDHQRRGGLLGPDAVAAAAEALGRRGAALRTRPSPWKLGPVRAELAATWLRGWVAAAVEQRPDLAPAAAGYLRRRLATGLYVEVHHADLLAIPGETPIWGKVPAPGAAP